MGEAMALRDLLAPWVSAPEVPVRHLTLDSRACEPGSLFVALAGRHAHGLDYLEGALAGGAVAVVYEPAPGLEASMPGRRSCTVPLIALERLGEHCSAIAGRFHAHPSSSMTLIGVTGTDGKTSVSQFLAMALDRPRRRCGVIGTLGWGFPGSLDVATHTTPDAVTLQGQLAALRDAGAQAVSMEVSSHALDQHRVAAVRMTVAVLTQVGRDHLDYHGSEAAYRAAKRALFERSDVAVRVLNLDDELGRELAAAMPASITYSAQGAPNADVRLDRFAASAAGMHLDIEVGGWRLPLTLPLMGRFNAANALAACAVLLALGLPTEQALERLKRLCAVPGRMERFVTAGRPTVVVDYAHTPGALAAALEAAREHCAGRLWVVFGCGGDRDRGKRPLMGRVASDAADRVVLTSDNPRHEDPLAIINEIRDGCTGAADLAIEAERELAIAHALASAAPEDLVLVAGKGHETEQVIGASRRPYSDREQVRECLDEVRP